MLTATSHHRLADLDPVKSDSLLALPRRRDRLPSCWHSEAIVLDSSNSTPPPGARLD